MENFKIEWTSIMDKETIEDIMQKLLKLIDDFHNEPTLDKAMDIDKSTSVLRFCIGEQNFLPLHYFRAAHEEAVKYIDNMNKQNNGDNK